MVQLNFLDQLKFVKGRNNFKGIHEQSLISHRFKCNEKEHLSEVDCRTKLHTRFGHADNMYFSLDHM